MNYNNRQQGYRNPQSVRSCCANTQQADTLYTARAVRDDTVFSVSTDYAGPVLASAYFISQRYCDLYEPAVAMSRGTIFRKLDLDFCRGC